MNRRVLMSVIGVCVSGISVGMFRHAAFGVDPFQSLMSGLDAAIPIGFGTLYVIVNAVLLLFALFTDRRRIGIATFINLFLLGYIAEYSQILFARLLPGSGSAARFVLLIAAIVLLCLASSFYITADLGVSTYDAIALVWASRQKRIPFAVCRVITDGICVMLGIALCRCSGYTWARIGGVVGIGTVITAFFMGPLIEWFNVHAARKFLAR